MTLPVNLLVGLGGAVVLAAGLMASRGLVAGGLVGGLAVFGLVVRWRGTPPLVMLTAAYLSFFPDGLPAGDPTGRGFVGPNLLDLLTVAAAAVYMSGHYRHLTQSAEAGDEPDEDELARLFIGVGAAILAGAVVLFAVTGLVPDYPRGPLRFQTVRTFFEEYKGGTWPVLDLVFARFLLLAGLLGGGALVAGLVLWLTRLNRLTPEEARLALLDTRWREGRREFARLETWRAAVRQPRGRQQRRVWRSCAVGVLLFGAAFVVFLWALSRLR